MVCAVFYFKSLAVATGIKAVFWNGRLGILPGQVKLKAIFFYEAGEAELGN
jgi:hypothetical protein